jgi:CTP:molybdopterin cytidylyltransferase MocA
MTVAAIILAEGPESALRDVNGVPNARRLVDAAWAGGALPIVVVSSAPGDELAAALAGSPALLAASAAEQSGPLGQISRGFDVARAEIEATDAALLWPAHMGWVDSETVTSLIEAHGTARAAVLRAAYRGTAGWPALVPLARLEALRELGPAMAPEALLDALMVEEGDRLIEVGDPGVTHDLDTPRAALPPFEGPPGPASGSHREWGSEAAAGPDAAPEPARTVT